MQIELTNSEAGVVYKALKAHARKCRHRLENTSSQFSTWERLGFVNAAELAAGVMSKLKSCVQPQHAESEEDEVAGLKQVMYSQGGSRIYFEEGGLRKLLVDTYAIEKDDSSFPIAVRDFIARWLKSHTDLGGKSETVNKESDDD